MNRIRRILIPAFAALMLAFNLPAFAAINAWLDRNQISAGETVQLTLQHNGQTGSQPDLSPLRQDFDVLGTSTGSSIQIVNGSMSSTKQVTLTLSPKHDGKLVIPSLTWDGDHTPSLLLVVSNNGAPASSNSSGGNSTNSGTATSSQGNRDVFLTTSLDQKQPFVQAAVTLTVRLYTDVPLYQGSLDLEPGNDVLVQQIGKDTRSEVQRDGRNYQMIERRYLLFPQRSGEIRIDGPVLDAQVPDTQNGGPFGNDPFFNRMFGSNPFAGMMGTARPMHLRANPIVFKVRPRPASWTGRDWLPAQKVTLQESWQPDSGEIHAGDPVTWHLRLDALGLTAAQLPDLSREINLPPGIKAYPDQPKLNTEVQGDSVNGTRDQDIALIASQAGRFVIPALHLSWWDTAKNVQREIELPSRTLHILPGSPSSSSAAPPPDLTAGNPAPAPAASSHLPINLLPGKFAGVRNNWPWFALAFGLLWLITLAAWWITSRRRPKVQAAPVVKNEEPQVSALGESESRKAFQRACKDNDAQAARRHLLDWARAVWPDDAPAGLNALGNRLNDAEIKTLLGQLDRACYAGGEWKGAGLGEKLKTLKVSVAKGSKQVQGLAGLYPQ